jgi:DNA primase
MTEMHLKALNRFTADVRLAFDADKAGQAAAERAIPIAGKVGVNLSIITIPAGKDPDELIKQDPQAWITTIEHKEYALDWLINRYKSQLDLETATGKRQFSDIVLAVIRQITDSVEQDHYLTKLAGIIGVSKEALQSKLSSDTGTKRTYKKGAALPQVADPGHIDHVKNQNQLLSLSLMRPSLRQHLEHVTPDMLADDAARAVLDFLKGNPDFDGDPAKLAALKDFIDYVKILTLQYEALYQDLDELELHYEATRLQVRLIERFVKTKKQALAISMHDADEKTTTALLQQAKELDNLLKLTKEHSHG